MLAVIYLSAGAGILIGTRRRGAAGLALGVLTAGALAVVLHGIPFEQTTAFRLVVLALPAALIVALVQRLGATRMPDAIAFLAALVPKQLPAIEQPRIGWLDWDEEVFTYTDLGDSFLLEFAGPLWVQCAYSPPYEEEVDEAEPGAEPERLEAAWSCQRKPPRLW
jgi:hypothetical protein